MNLRYSGFLMAGAEGVKRHGYRDWHHGRSAYSDNLPIGKAGLNGGETIKAANRQHTLPDAIEKDSRAGWPTPDLETTPQRVITSGGGTSICQTTIVDLLLCSLEARRGGQKDARELPSTQDSTKEGLATSDKLEISDFEDQQTTRL